MLTQPKYSSASDVFWSCLPFQMLAMAAFLFTVVSVCVTMFVPSVDLCFHSNCTKSVTIVTVLTCTIFRILMFVLRFVQNGHKSLCILWVVLILKLKMFLNINYTKSYRSSRDSSVGIATDYRLDSRGSIPGRDKNFSLLHSVQTAFEALPASYPMGTAGFFFCPGAKRQERETDHSAPSSA
jgi:hypothetical protein